jgi:Rrf2 family protein
MLQITKKADYAVRLMVEVAAHSGGVIATAEIAERQDIPYQFLRKVAQELAAKGLLIGERGGHGGLTLGRAPEDVSVLDILRALDLPPINDCAVDPDNCGRQKTCAAFGVWFEAQAAIDRVLAGATLSKLVRAHRVLLARSGGGESGQKARDRDSIGLVFTGQMAHESGIGNG